MFLAQEVVLAARRLARNPSYALLATLTLAFGIGSSTAIFSVFDAVLLRPLPYGEPDRIVRLFERNISRGWETFGVSPLNFVDWKAQSRSFAAMAAYQTGGGNARIGASSERVRFVRTTPSLFEVLGIGAAKGRTLLPGDGSGGEPVVVVSERLLARVVGGDADMRIVIDGTSYRIVGSMPAEFAYPDTEVDLWLPFPDDLTTIGTRGQHFLSVVARLAPGVTVERAGKEIETIAGRLALEYPDQLRGWDAVAYSLRDWTLGSSASRVNVLWAAAGLLLLIACVNVASLNLVRNRTRSKELATRLAVGAERRHLVRQLLAENLALSLAAGVVGVGIAAATTRFLEAQLGATIHGLEDVSLDLVAVAFALTLSLGAGLLSGMLPAISSSRLDASTRSSDGGRTATTSREGRRVIGAMVIAEVTLSVVLLMGAGLLGRSLLALLDVPIGFDPDHILTFRIAPPMGEIRDVEDYVGAIGRTAVFYDEMIERLEAIPGVESAGAINRLPLAGNFWVSSVFVEGQSYPAGEEPTGYERVVGGGFFDAMRIPLLEGVIPRGDEPYPAAVVDEEFARRLHPDGSLIGRRVSLEGTDAPDDGWYTIVGIVGSVRHNELAIASEPTIYTPVRFARSGFANDFGMSVVLRTTVEPESLVEQIRAVAAEQSHGLPVFEVRTMNELIAGSIEDRSSLAILIGVFAVAAALLAAVGLHGLIANVVRTHDREMAIRLALGATPRILVLGIVGRASMLTSIGVGLGLFGAAVSVRILESFLFQVDGRDPGTMAGVTLLMFAVSLIALVAPSIRVGLMKPAEIMRSE